MVLKGGIPRRRARQRLVSLSRMTRDAAPCARCDGHGAPPAPRPTESSGKLRATVHRVAASASLHYHEHTAQSATHFQNFTKSLAVVGSPRGDE
jgi:hypothetical protein